MANIIDKVRVLLVGDSGVGKTCLTHLITHKESLSRPGWTVGCNIEVKLHEYKEGTPQQQLYFIEFFDIGGSLSHRNTRGVFYAPIHGIILVHDLTNRKSQENLREWLYEILNKEGKDVRNSSGDCSFDPEQFLGSTQLPLLVMGAKLDLLDERRQPKPLKKIGSIAEQCGAEEIWLNCRDPRSLSAGTTDAVKLSRFFDRVIEKKNQSRDSSTSFADKRKCTSTFNANTETTTKLITLLR
ncbi:rab-like protein 3 isoform X1 [Rhagoletis pomonella]|uniref:rab-like protein 3 isoform X1 n=1 Tax=Rhagoletis pomonella TaxID=28610 RepID=UPI0017853293|nr:rab-like protein 3 isoform X1 [Rhagoletis pomonella]XP_036342042.1 rab-like protein 3 isoform X1 [Rhagoletis pomonella]